VNATRWRFRSDIGTYRDYSNGTLEINPETFPSGNFESFSSGGAESGDGGGAESGDGGGAESEKASGATKSGMFWNYRSILGFRVKFPSEDRTRRESLLFYANPEGAIYMNLLIREFKELDIAPVNLETLSETSVNFVELLKERIQHDPEIHDQQNTSDSLSCLIDRALLSKGKIRLTLLSRLQNQAESSPFLLELNSQGLIVGRKKQKHFQRFYSSPRGIVDLIGLFFLNVGQADQSFPDGLRAYSQQPLHPLASEFISQFAKQPYVIFQSPIDQKAVPIACHLSDASAKPQERRRR
jgi:hypothetical protein